MYTVKFPEDELYHHGVLGMKWGVRRYQSYAENPKLSDRKKNSITKKIQNLETQRDNSISVRRKKERYNKKIEKAQKDRQRALDRNEDWRKQDVEELTVDNDIYKIERQQKIIANQTRAENAKKEYQNLQAYDYKVKDNKISESWETTLQRKDLMDARIDEIRRANNNVERFQRELNDADNVLMKDIASSNEYHDRRSEKINDIYDKKVEKLEKKRDSNKYDKKIEKIKEKFSKIKGKGPDGSNPASEKATNNSEKVKLSERNKTVEKTLFAYFESTGEPIVLSDGKTKIALTKSMMETVKNDYPEEYEGMLDLIADTLERD